jgi:hypothetical protein
VGSDQDHDQRSARGPGGRDSRATAQLPRELARFAGLWGVYDFRTGDQHGLDGRDTIYIYYDAAHGTWMPYDGPNTKT